MNNNDEVYTTTVFKQAGLQIINVQSLPPIPQIVVINISDIVKLAKHFNIPVLRITNAIVLKDNKQSPFTFSAVAVVIDNIIYKHITEMSEQKNAD